MHHHTYGLHSTTTQESKLNALVHGLRRFGVSLEGGASPENSSKTDITHHDCVKLQQLQYDVCVELDRLCRELRQMEGPCLCARDFWRGADDGFRREATMAGERYDSIRQKSLSMTQLRTRVAASVLPASHLLSILGTWLQLPPLHAPTRHTHLHSHAFIVPPPTHAPTPRLERRGCAGGIVGSGRRRKRGHQRQ
jgi:hypothetical protein